MEKGKLIVIYGINNLGKTVQARRLVDALVAAGKQASYLKYPLYDLEPSGPILYNYLREGNEHNFNEREFQLLQILNRSQYDTKLRDRIATGEWVVAEDYVGTGVAWGMRGNESKELLQKLNQHLIGEDLGILFEGERFLQAREKNHVHENDDALTERVRTNHDLLAKEYNWHQVRANQSIDEVAHDVWRIVKTHFHL